MPGPLEFTRVESWAAEPDPENFSYLITSPLCNSARFIVLHLQTGENLGEFASFSEASNAAFDDYNAG